ncbi:MAG TPA: hypothetical protein VHE30_18985 [Polyangiaceae bacterium]|nr:hypothetical protein [Polyangiaceae bacterium]
MNIQWLKSFAFMVVAAMTLLCTSQASADKAIRERIFEKQEVVAIGDLKTHVHFHVTLRSDGTWTKTLNVEQWACPAIDPKSTKDVCHGKFVMGVKGKDGKWIHFKTEGNLTPQGLHVNFTGKSKEIEANYESLADGKFEARYHVEGIKGSTTGGNWFDGLIKDVGNALAVVGPALLAL